MYGPEAITDQCYLFHWFEEHCKGTSHLADQGYLFRRRVELCGVFISARIRFAYSGNNYHNGGEMTYDLFVSLAGRKRAKETLGVSRLVSSRDYCSLLTRVMYGDKIHTAVHVYL